MTTGEKISELRKRKGLSQEALGERLGVSRQAVSKWESDIAIPTMDNLIELGCIFGVTVDTILRPDGVLPSGNDNGAQCNKDNDVEITDEYDNFPNPPPNPEVTHVLPRWIKTLACVSTGLLGLSLVCGIASVMWLCRLQEQVDRLPAGGLYLPSAPVVTTTENSDIADYSIDYAPNPEEPERLLLRLRAMPKERNEGEDAKLSVSCGDELAAVDAGEQNGYYTGEVSIGLSNDPAAISLMLTKDGKTRTLHMETLYGLKDALGLNVSWELSADGRMGWSAGKGGYATGQVYIVVGKNSGAAEVWPVSGKVALMVDGKEYDSVSVDEIPQRVSEWTDIPQYEEHISSGYLVNLPWDYIPLPNTADLDLRIEVTDNYGRVWLPY